MRVLMSLNNVGIFNSQFSLASLDTAEGDGGGDAEIRLVDCSAFLDIRRDGGITGLCRLPDGGLALAVQGAKPKVVILGADWSVKKIVRDDRFSDIHSLTCRDGYLFVTSTGVNKILKVALSSYRVSLFWEYPVDQPMLHVNALVFDGERAMVSSHKVPPQAEGGAVSGGCWYLDDYEVAINGLTQPHSLMIHDGEVVCLSSHDHRIARRKADGAVVFAELEGYPRGLAFDSGEALIGVSSKRFVSRKRDGVYKYADFRHVVGNPLFMSGLSIADQAFTIRRRIDLTPVTFEVYDVIADPGPPAELLAPGPAASIRAQTAKRHEIHLREQLDELRAGAAAP